MFEPAVVTQASPLLVQLDSSATAVPALCLGSYTPALNDRVSVDQQGSQVVVLGTTGTGSTAADTTPTGRIVMQAGSAPAGYLICNGASVLRADYPALSAYWAASTPSYPYGAVDGTHMSLPNFPQGTFPTGGTPGITGGEATHVLTTTEMPSHQHTQVLGGSITTSAGTAGSYVIGNANSGLVSATGGGGAHNNIPPFVGVSFLVKT